MCGIAGIWDSSGNKIVVNTLEKMTDAINHRGPDGYGHWISEDRILALGHRRLSIIDLSSSAAQPMIYRKELKDVTGISFMEDMKDVKHNYSYFPIFIDETAYGMTRDELYFKLQEKNIFGRRYFYPLISEFPTYKGLPSAKKSNLPNAHKLANSVICLPMYHELQAEDINRVIEIIKHR